MAYSMRHDTLPFYPLPHPIPCPVHSLYILHFLSGCVGLLLLLVLHRLCVVQCDSILGLHLAFGVYDCLEDRFIFKTSRREGDRGQRCVGLSGACDSKVRHSRIPGT